MTAEAAFEASRTRPKKRIVIWTVLSSLVISLIAAELLLGHFAPIADPYAPFKGYTPPKPISRRHPPNFSVETEAEPGLPGMPPGRRHFTTNNVGFRGDFLPRPKPANEYRIFMVGASTTENFYLDDKETITSVLQTELNRQAGRKKEYRVYAVGQSGHVSPDHIAMISERVVHLEPDMIILFCGVNDLSFAIFQYDYIFLSTTPVRYSSRDLIAFTATELQLPRYAYVFGKRIFGKDEGATLEEVTTRSNYRAKADLRKRAPLARQRPRTDLASYETNLRSIIGVARAHGSKLVFVTQPSSWNSRVDPKIADWHWMTVRNGVTYPEDWMDEALESYNDVMRRLGRQNEIPVLDLSRAIERSREYFYDDCHFNVAGARRAGRELGEFILAGSRESERGFRSSREGPLRIGEPK